MAWSRRQLDEFGVEASLRDVFDFYAARTNGESYIRAGRGSKHLAFAV